MSTAALPVTVRVAFRVEINDMGCICFAETIAKARWQAVKAYWDAGYGSRRVWPRPIAWRRPCFDNHPAKDRTDRCVFAEDQL